MTIVIMMKWFHSIYHGLDNEGRCCVAAGLRSVIAGWPHQTLARLSIFCLSVTCHYKASRQRTRRADHDYSIPLPVRCSVMADGCKLYRASSLCVDIVPCFAYNYCTEWLLVLLFINSVKYLSLAELLNCRNFHWTFVKDWVCKYVQMMQLAADKFVQDELVDRLNSINERLNTLRVESEEVECSSHINNIYRHVTPQLQNCCHVTIWRYFN